MAQPLNSADPADQQVMRAQSAGPGIEGEDRAPNYDAALPNGVSRPEASPQRIWVASGGPEDSWDRPSSEWLWRWREVDGGSFKCPEKPNCDGRLAACVEVDGPLE